MKTKLSLLGMYNYDETLFDKLKFPEGIDRETAISVILTENGEFDMIYYNVELVKKLMSVLSVKMSYKWTRLVNTITLDYNPIENYNRVEEITEEGTSSGTSDQIGEGTSVNSSKPFDDTWSDREKNVDNSVNKVDTSASSNLNRKGKISGNIGVTTTQQMIEQERGISDFDVYAEIAADFAAFFCVLVY